MPAGNRGDVTRSAYMCKGTGVVANMPEEREENKCHYKGWQV
jgi:hypothetical protein